MVKYAEEWEGIQLLTAEGFRLIDRDSHLQVMDRELCKRNFPYFLFNYAYTFDETDFDNSEKRFPRKKYLAESAKILQEYRKSVWGKSRQLMLSWICCAFISWLVMFGSHRRAMIQSKKERDAQELLLRCVMVLKRLPTWLKVKFSPTKGEVNFENDSKIQAFPQGAEQVRSYVPSILFADESGFQAEYEEAHGAAMPMIGNGYYMSVSTAEGGSFHERLFNDDINNIGREIHREDIIPGMAKAMCSTGFVSIRLHYSCDGEKHTPEYIAELRASMPEYKFKQEMEIDFRARSGRPVWPEFDENVHVRNIPITEDMIKYGFMDHGRVNPTVFLEIYVMRNDDLYVSDEYYQGERTINENCGNIKRQFGRSGALSGFVTIYIDPSTNKKEDNSENTIAQTYADNGINTCPANNAIDTGIENVGKYLLSALARHSLETGILHPIFKRINGEEKAVWRGVRKAAEHPAIYFNPRCDKTTFEVKNWKWRQLKKQIINRNDPDKPEDKDDHAADCIRYAANARLKWNASVWNAPEYSFNRLIREERERVRATENISY